MSHFAPWKFGFVPKRYRLHRNLTLFFQIDKMEGTFEALKKRFNDKWTSLLRAEPRILLVLPLKTSNLSLKVTC